MTEHKCPRCGTELKVVVVRAPVTPLSSVPHVMRIKDFLAGVSYETREEYADCARCMGDY